MKLFISFSAISPIIGGIAIGWILASVFHRYRNRNRNRSGLLCLAERSQVKKIKVYHTRTFRSARVSWLVQELGVEDDFEFLSYNPYKASDEEKEWYKTNMHPHGSVPAALVDHTNGKPVIIIESAAICLYIAELYNRLLPSHDMLSVYYDWTIYGVATLDQMLSIFENNLDLSPDKQNVAALESAYSKAAEFCKYFEEHLIDKEYICGDKFTTADVVVGYCTMWASVIKGGKILFGYPRVKAYLERLKARPAFVNAIGTPREWIQAGSEGI